MCGKRKKERDRSECTGKKDSTQRQEETLWPRWRRHNAFLIEDSKHVTIVFSQWLSLAPLTHSPFIHAIDIVSTLDSLVLSILLCSHDSPTRPTRMKIARKRQRCIQRSKVLSVVGVKTEVGILTNCWNEYHARIVSLKARKSIRRGALMNFVKSF